MRRIAIAVFSFVCAASAASFTLEQVLSAPFPSELVAAPGGGKVAWLLNDHGARNIWIAAAPDFKGMRLTNYTGDDGTDVGQVQWTADARKSGAALDENAYLALARERAASPTRLYGSIDRTLFENVAARRITSEAEPPSRQAQKME